MLTDDLECETCKGIGTIDMRLGGEWNSDPKSKCPDCEGSGRIATSAIEAEVRAEAHKPLGPATAEDQKIYDAMVTNYNKEAQEPVAWLHNSRTQADVITSAVKKLLIDEKSRHGFDSLIQRFSVSKAENYTIPLYTAPQPPAPCPAPLDESHYCPDCEALQAKVTEQSKLIEKCRAALRTCVKYADQFFDADSVASAIAAIETHQKGSR